MERYGCQRKRASASEARHLSYPTEAPPRFELGVEVLQFSPGFCDSLRLFLSGCRADHPMHDGYSPRSVPLRLFRANLPTTFPERDLACCHSAEGRRMSICRRLVPPAALHTCGHLAALWPISRTSPLSWNRTPLASHPRDRDCRARGHSRRVRFVTGCRTQRERLPPCADINASSLAG